MRNATKLLAFVLAFVMVLSMVPMASAQTVHTHGIEEYPEIFANEEVLVSIGEPGLTVYMRFTPTVTAEYTFASHDTDWRAPQGYLYDAEMNLLAKHEDNAFAGCVNVKKIVFSGDLPTILSAFIDVKADAWYPSGNETWTTDALLNYGGSLTWHAMCREHSYGKWTPVVDATCTESGIDEHTCSSCKWTEQRISEPTGHIWDEGTVNENGETVYTCRICGATTGELPFFNPFTDVNEDDWFYDSVVWAVKGGITNGISETEFGISSNCNRAQAVTFLYRALAD